ncbi:MAG TPA: response regulator, partial [Verrucomicrobiae bacterium]|nr:response regulator [Verrucomicrobiae bacterium]
MSKILIVDDDASIRTSISMALSREGHEIFMAPDTSEALRLAHSHLPDLIISDVCMEGGDGFEFLKTVRADSRVGGIPFIMMTGSPDQAGLLRGVENAADGYLVKPFSVQSLLSVIKNRLKREHLNQRDARQIKEQFHRVLEGSPDFAAILDPHSLDLLFINSAGAQMLGLEQNGSASLRPFFPFSSERDFVTNAVSDALKHGHWRGETAFVLPSSHKVEVEIVLQAHCHDDGEVQFLSVMARDLTERRKNESALRASERRFRCLVNALPDAVIMNDRDNRITFCNAQASALFGYDLHELLGSPLHPLFVKSPAGDLLGEQISESLRRRASESIVVRKTG